MIASNLSGMSQAGNGDYLVIEQTFPNIGYRVPVESTVPSTRLKRNFPFPKSRDTFTKLRTEPLGERIG